MVPTIRDSGNRGGFGKRASCFDRFIDESKEKKWDGKEMET